MKAPDGVTSLGLELTHVLAGTDMEETFDQLFKKTLIATDNAGAAATSGTTTAASAATETNIYYGGAQPIIAPELDANAEPGVWYGLAMNTDSKPFEMQFENGAEPQIIILGDGTEHAAMKNEVLFRGKMFGNAGYAIPHCVIRFEPT
jgi:hypothetical protein